MAPNHHHYHDSWVLRLLVLVVLRQWALRLVLEMDMDGPWPSWVAWIQEEDEEDRDHRWLEEEEPSWRVVEVVADAWRCWHYARPAV